MCKKKFAALASHTDDNISWDQKGGQSRAVHGTSAFTIISSNKFPGIKHHSDLRNLPFVRCAWILAEFLLASAQASTFVRKANEACYAFYCSINCTCRRCYL